MKQKAMETDDDLSDEDGDLSNLNKKSLSSTIMLLILPILFTLLFVVISLLYRKRYLLKRQFQARQFENTEFDEFNLSMESIQGDSMYTTLKNEDDLADDESKYLITGSADDESKINEEIVTTNKPIYIKKPKTSKPKPPHNINI